MVYESCDCCGRHHDPRFRCFGDDFQLSDFRESEVIELEEAA